MDKVIRRYNQVLNAYNRLKEAIEIYEKEKKEIYIDAIIQRFEFCTELSCNLLKEYLSYEKLGECTSPRSTLKEAYKQGIIENGETWFDIIDDRNLTSNTYDEITANRIKDNVINKYMCLFNDLINKMKELIK